MALSTTVKGRWVAINPVATPRAAMYAMTATRRRKESVQPAVGERQEEMEGDAP